MLFIFMIKSRDSRISVDYILSKVSQKDIFEYYLGINIEEKINGGLFVSPLRQDDNPTCSFKVIRDRIIFSDWAGETGLDCFKLVQYLTGLSFLDSLELICVHFSLFTNTEKEEYKFVFNKEKIKELSSATKEVIIRVKRREFENKDKRFWKLFGLDLEDLEEDIKPIKCFWLNNKIYYPRDIAYVYKEPHYGIYDFKIYIPYANKNELKFIHNNANIIQGKSKLKYDKRVLIITSSFKDVKVLRKIEKVYNLGFEVVAPMSENIFPKEEIKELISKYSYTFLYLNNDLKGIQFSEKYSKLFNISFFINKESLPKDPSDIAKLYGFDRACLEVTNLINNNIPPF